MAKLKNSIVEKLVNEGKVTHHSCPPGLTPKDVVEIGKDLYHKQKRFEYENFKAGYNSRKVILS